MRGTAFAILILCCIVVITGVARPAYALSPGSPVASGSEHKAALPSLSRVVELASKRAPDIAIGRARLAASRSERVGARLTWAQNPYMETVATQGTDSSQGFGLNSTLWLWGEIAGQRGKRTEAADAYVAWNRAGFGATRASVAGAAVRAYGAAVTAQARIEVLENTVLTSAEQARFYAARVDAADATLSEARLSDVELIRNRVLLEEAQAQLAAALGELSRLTGMRFDKVDRDATPPPLAARDGAFDLNRSPIIQAARSEASYHAAEVTRWKREGVGAMGLMLTAGHGTFGGAQVGAGLAYEFPIFRRYQGEQARAAAAQTRALAEAEAHKRSMAARLAALGAEHARLQRAVDLLSERAVPAAQGAVDAAVATQQAGKGDLLMVLTSRRDLALLRLRRLELSERQWQIVSEVVSMTGELP